MSPTATETRLTYQVKMTGQKDPAIYDGALLTPEETCAYLEEGGIIYFPESPFGVSEEDRDFLISQKQTAGSLHKNIAYKPKQSKLTGIETASPEDIARLHLIMIRYCRETGVFIDNFLSPYKDKWDMDYGSYRPIEEQGRKMRTRARNDLLHVDSFPTRATYGKRILRVFTNISRTQTRVWNTSYPFERLYEKFKHETKPFIPDTDKPAFRYALGRLTGIHSLVRPAYDRWMMYFHNFLKENAEFQEHTLKTQWEFPPGSSWVVYTDCVSHAVLEGQHALEQTFMVHLDGLVRPDKAPINILNRAI